jgi:hypothetical protein
LHLTQSTKSRMPRHTTSLALRGSVALSLLLLAPSAFAYLDPSTGSMILSAIVGLFATLALALKTYWYKLKALFRRTDPEKTEAGQERTGESDSSAEREQT